MVSGPFHRTALGDPRHPASGALGPAPHGQEDHFHSRIDRYYESPRREAAYSILAKLSLSKGGLRRAKLFADFERVLLERGETLVAEERKRLFNHLMRDLENDFYVAEIQPGVFDFASGLLKKWWKKYYA